MNTEHQDYYNQYPVETEKMMIKIFGSESVENFYLLSAFKYRMRSGYKNKDKMLEDFEKEQVCLRRYRELKKDRETKQTSVGIKENNR